MPWKGIRIWFEGKLLSEAIRLTLEQRGTELPDRIVAFSHKFIATKQIQRIGQI